MNFLKKYLWLISLCIGGFGTLFIWFCLPRQSQIDEWWWLVVKFAVFAFAIIGISFFPNKLRASHLLCCLPFIPFLCYIIPRLSFSGIFGTIEDPVKQGEFYTVLYLLCYPLIMMSIAFAHRMGGGKPGQSIKICLIGITLIFSGLLDLCFNTVNGRPLAESLDYAYHIIIIFGRSLTWKEGFIFALCHIPLIVLFIWLPLDKWFEKIGLTEKRTEEKNEWSM